MESGGSHVRVHEFVRGQRDVRVAGTNPFRDLLHVRPIGRGAPRAGDKVLSVADEVDGEWSSSEPLNADQLSEIRAAGDGNSRFPRSP